jgi:hypothetical protein
MRKFLLAAVLAIIPSVASAQLYIEGAVGITQVPEIETKTYSVDVPNVGLLDAGSQLEYARTYSAGAEAGIRFLGVRLGASWEMASTELDSGTIAGTLDGSPYSFQGTGDEIAAATGLTFDHDIQIAAANLYFNLPLPVIEPFVGVGAGAAFIDNASTEIALSASAGARLAIGSRAYVGARYRFTFIQGPQNDLGINYDPIMFHSVSLILGLNLGPL